MQQQIKRRKRKVVKQDTDLDYDSSGGENNAKETIDKINQLLVTTQPVTRTL